MLPQLGRTPRHREHRRVDAGPPEENPGVSNPLLDEAASGMQRWRKHAIAAATKRPEIRSLHWGLAPLDRVERADDRNLQSPRGQRHSDGGWVRGQDMNHIDG